MNFDELQKQWDNQSSEDVKIQKDLKNLNTANNIFEDLRKKIKTELIITIISFAFLFVIPIVPIYKINGVVTFFYYFFIFYLLIAAIVTYLRFYHFYKISKDYEINSSKELLLKVYYELKYALDTYFITTIIATPNGIGLYFILFSFGNSEKYFAQLMNFSETFNSNPKFFIWLLLLIVFSIVFVGGLLYYMYVIYYGSRLKLIKEILNQLEE
ncbi:hypothetical protein OBK28_01825 [Empedobacter falsenii]|uniref:Uncharacterized protein n=1 Tax=Empedobacter falsenii TaxID=343874 RepID=A0ABY8VAE5_9FLAO|nr:MULTISPECIES: hypothetical protein [Empedobacter]MDM1524023.1 hypothetical protein [Empedobacter sp. 225-1]MDM1543966.1 hypothetical protein [Empedobacter sp. 189-2]WIH98654.1 hypothetical protein OBA43_06930 [Empedobacter falsenii]